MTMTALQPDLLSEAVGWLVSLWLLTVFAFGTWVLLKLAGPERCARWADKVFPTRTVGPKKVTVDMKSPFSAHDLTITVQVTGLWIARVRVAIAIWVFKLGAAVAGFRTVHVVEEKVEVPRG